MGWSRDTTIHQPEFKHFIILVISLGQNLKNDSSPLSLENMGSRLKIFIFSGIYKPFCDANRNDLFKKCHWKIKIQPNKRITLDRWNIYHF